MLIYMYILVKKNEMKFIKPGLENELRKTIINVKGVYT